MKKWIQSLRDHNMFRWSDLWIIGILILLSFSPLVIFWHQQTQSATTNTAHKAELIAVVSHDGKKIKSFTLSGHKGTTTWTYRAKDGDYNTIEIRDDKVRIAKANCADQVCVNQGYKYKAGQTIVCLPHKLLIEVKSSDGKLDDGGLVN